MASDGSQMLFASATGSESGATNIRTSHCFQGRALFLQDLRGMKLIQVGMEERDSFDSRLRQYILHLLNKSQKHACKARGAALEAHEVERRRPPRLEMRMKCNMAEAARTLEHDIKG